MLKALALRKRKEPKDAFDLYYVVRNYGAGVEDVADRLRALLGDPVAEKAVGFLMEAFETLDHAGPVRAAAFAGYDRDEAYRADVHEALFDG